MLLHSLLKQLDPQLSLTGIPNPEVTGVREDSRHVQPGDLFAARVGPKADGQQFVADAIAKGAAAVIASGASNKGAVPVIGVADPGGAASILANAFHGNPGQQVKVLP